MTELSGLTVAEPVGVESDSVPSSGTVIKSRPKCSHTSFRTRHTRGRNANTICRNANALYLVCDPYCIYYMYYYHTYILLTLSTFNFLSLSFLSQHWTGPELPQSPQQLWPQRRQAHTSFSLCDPDTDPADPCQVVIGGLDIRSDPLADVWVLHINTMQWEEVSCGGLWSLSIMSILSLTHALHATLVFTIL